MVSNGQPVNNSDQPASQFSQPANQSASEGICQSAVRVYLSQVVLSFDQLVNQLAKVTHPVSQLQAHQFSMFLLATVKVGKKAILLLFHGHFS